MKLKILVEKQDKTAPQQITTKYVKMVLINKFEQYSI